MHYTNGHTNSVDWGTNSVRACWGAKCWVTVDDKLTQGHNIASLHAHILMLLCYHTVNHVGIRGTFSLSGQRDGFCCICIFRSKVRHFRPETLIKYLTCIYRRRAPSVPSYKCPKTLLLLANNLRSKASAPRWFHPSTNLLRVLPREVVCDACVIREVSPGPMAATARTTCVGRWPSPHSHCTSRE